VSGSPDAESVAIACSVESKDFVDAMGQVCAAVTVVTTNGDGGRYGMTVSAMCSVSADPPHLLVCINQSNLVMRAIDVNRCFCVNVLGLQHRDVAQVFAGRLPRANGGDRFACADWDELTTGSPVLADALAVFDCVVKQQLNCATHQVFVGRVVAACSRNGKALAYTGRSFCEPQPLSLDPNER
jgi:flavin reductase